MVTHIIGAGLAARGGDGNDSLASDNGDKLSNEE